jgi:glycosyltransferase involved in cell wall biosynthesis
MKILFLVPYPVNEAPSQRFRFEQYFEALKERKIYFDIYPFYDKKSWNQIYSDHYVRKTVIIFLAFIKRIYHVLKCIQYDWVFLHREAAPAGPPIFEWIMSRVFRRKIIFDFDDAIWLTDQNAQEWLLRKIKGYNKISGICRWSEKVSCGNEYLRQFALKYNDHCFLNPTTVDTVNIHNRIHKVNSGKVVIGWTGSHTTLKYLYTITDVLVTVLENPGISLLIICNKRPQWNIRDYTFIPWSKDSEIEDLLKTDIGLMPLPDDPWTRGKCGFKAIQYLSLGIPALVSPLEVNRKIVDHGLNGYYCTEPRDWIQYIRELSGDPAKRIEFGRKGREKIIRSYSATSNLNNFLGFFE